MCETTGIAKLSIQEFGSNALGMRKKCESKRRLDGKVVVITGANTGIGKETTLQLSLRGAKIYIGCRSPDKAETAVNEILAANPSADITSLKLDLSSLKSVRQFANQIKNNEKEIDILVNNAGVYACPEWKTEDGFEMQFGTNYLGPFLLTLWLLPLLKKAPNARIVNVASSMHKIGKIHFDNINLRNRAYSENKAYAQSKLAQVMFTQELARRLADISVHVYALNPGAVRSDMQRHANIPKVAMKMFLSPEMGAQTSLFCVLEESLDNESGHYYDNCKREELSKSASDMEAAKRLWEMSEDMVKLEPHLRI